MARLGRIFRRMALLSGIIAGGTLLVCIILLTACQRRLIYYPRPYEKILLANLPQNVIRLDYQTRQGRQTAFYVEPLNEAAIPADLWLVFNGNGTNALDWLDTMEKPPRNDVGFLLMDYPGYGACEGKPTRGSIRENVEGAYAALLKHLGKNEQDFRGHTGVLAHSLGCAVGLEFATRHEVDRMILLSPFTRLKDVAIKVVGWPLNNCLIDRFDNVKSLETLNHSAHKPEIHILHGSADEVVPVQMGRAQAAKYPHWIQYEEWPGVDHAMIAWAAEKRIKELMGEEESNTADERK